MNSKHGQWPSFLPMLALLPGVVLAQAAEGQQQTHPPGIALPDGEGRVLLLAACTRCHDLRGLPAYKGYWNDTRWRSMIETMVKNGAPLTRQQTEVLADYLAEHFGMSAPGPQ